MRLIKHLAGFLTLTLGVTAWLAAATPAAHGGMPPFCAVPDHLIKSEPILARTTAKLRRGEAVKIVAIGSSSTFGTGASSPGASYPSQLEAGLRELFPRAGVTVLNRGIPGETSAAMVARFQHDVIDEHPDLMIWQTGTNSALGGSDIEQFTANVVRGIEMARAAQIEILLMGPQYAPRFESVRNRMLYLEHLHTIARSKDVGLFPRYAVMKHWIESAQFTRQTMIDPDGLHLTDRSYACLGWLVARVLAGPEVATAGRSP